MGIIYKITNKINNFVYVGQTIQSLQIRWGRHIREANNNNPKHLYCAMRKYGIENFKIEIIEECDNSLLDEREIYWIDKLQSYYEFGKGYNMTYGGQGVNTLNISKNVITQKWQEGKSIQEISEELHCSRAQARTRVYALEEYNSDEALKRGRQVFKKRKNKPIVQCDENHNIIQTFESARQAEEVTGISYKNISNALRFNVRAGGYYWIYVDEKDKTRSTHRQVAQLDKEGNIIKIFDSVKEAALSINKYATGIYECCSGRQKTCGGYGWKYIEKDLGK